MDDFEEPGEIEEDSIGNNREHTMDTEGEEDHSVTEERITNDNFMSERETEEILVQEITKIKQGKKTKKVQFIEEHNEKKQTERFIPVQNITGEKQRQYDKKKQQQQ